jgi:polyisoprenoid-binding protein YceI
MKRWTLLLTTLFLTTSAQAVTQVWDLDLSHSSVNFSVDHLAISETTGKFDKYEVLVNSDKEDFTDAQFSVTIFTNSINTADAKRDEHLKNKDFFDVEKNPTIKFEGEKFELKNKKKNEYKVKGKLTLNGVTKDVVFDGKFNGIQKDPWGGIRAGLKVSGKVDRYDYNLKYNSVLDKGGLAIGKEVRITANIELVKKVAEVKK